VLLTLKEYQRMYKVINSIVENEGWHTAHSCIYFSYFGAYILKKCYNIEAEIRCGHAAYCIGGDNKVICFGELNHRGNFSDKSVSFHCWIEAKGWLIDFLAPNFPQMQGKEFDVESLPSYMLQKPLAEMSPLNQLDKRGDFYLEFNSRLAKEKLSFLSKQIIFLDMAKLCADWYTKPPKKIHDQLKISNKIGTEMIVKLRGNRVTGKW
jgi:hypothetical protein